MWAESHRENTGDGPGPRPGLRDEFFKIPKQLSYALILEVFSSCDWRTVEYVYWVRNRRTTTRGSLIIDDATRNGLRAQPLLFFLSDVVWTLLVSFKLQAPVRCPAACGTYLHNIHLPEFNASAAHASVRNLLLERTHPSFEFLVPSGTVAYVFSEILSLLCFALLSY